MPVLRVCSRVNNAVRFLNGREPVTPAPAPAARGRGLRGPGPSVDDRLDAYGRAADRDACRAGNDHQRATLCSFASNWFRFHCRKCRFTLS